MKHEPRILFACLVSALAAQPTARAAEDHLQHHHPAEGAQVTPPSTVKVRYADAVLTEQSGRQVKLQSEVFGDRIVILDFVYTTCTTVCPVLTAALVNVQTEFGNADDLRLVSITVDPARDTPGRLREYADKLGVKPGWVWLTGPTGRVNEVLKGFGAYAASFEDHPPLVLVGDTRSGNWSRFYGFSDPRLLIAKVQELRAARANTLPEGHKH